MFERLLVSACRLRDHDPSVEPIIVLRCGHAYTLSTLDGCMGLASVYAKVRVSCRGPSLSVYVGVGGYRRPL